MLVDWRRVRKIAFCVVIVSFIALLFLAYLHYLDFKKVLLIKASHKATLILDKQSP